MKFKTSALAAMLILAVSLPAGSALAGGGGKQIPTFFTAFKYKVKDGDASFKGTIDSTKGGCIKDRKVIVYRKKSGNVKKLGGDRTNNKGKFDVDLGSGRPGDGTFYAEVNKAKIGDSNQNTCLGRTSPTIKLSS